MKLKVLLCMQLVWLITGWRVNTAFAQMPCITEHYSTEDGLSHDVITSIYKDRQGYMWFGTWDGLNRFDGSKFTVFKSSAGDSSQINNNRIDQITEDRYDHLWIKAYDAQVYRFDKTTGRFLSLTILLNLKEKINVDKILSIDEDCIWISTLKSGIICVNGIGTAGLSCRQYKQGAAENYRLPSNNIRFFYKDNEGRKWIGTSNGLVCLQKQQKNNWYGVANLGIQAKEEFISVAESRSQLFFGTKSGGLFVFDKQKKQYTVKHVSNAGINGVLIDRGEANAYLTTGGGELIAVAIKTGLITRSIYPTGEALYSLYEDHSGMLWIEPGVKGVIQYNPLTQKFKTFSQKNDAKSTKYDNHFKVMEDHNGVVWCVLRDGGFGYYDSKTDEFKYFYNEPDAKDRRFSNLITTAFYDPAGVFWFHTDEHGLEKIILQPNIFQTRLPNEKGTFQSDNEVRGVYVDKQNRLWICVKNGQVFVYKDGERLPVSFTNFVGQNIGAVYSITEDRNGAIWMGTKANGLYQAVATDASNLRYRLVNYRHSEADPQSISSDEIYSIKEDAAGRIWVGSFENGLNLVNQKDAKVSFTRVSETDPAYPQTCRKIRHLTTDARGRLWIGTTGGLVVLNYKGGKFSYQTYNKIPGDIHSLGNNGIQQIYRDNKNRMFLATSGGGLNMAVDDQTTGRQKFKVYTSKQGLPNDYVMSCIGDNYNHLWLATKAGLSMFDLRTEKFKNFNSYDGIPKRGFSEKASQATKDGKLVFGTIKGYMVFDPTRVKNYLIGANLVLTNLQINNKDVAVSDSTGILTEDINHTSAIRLNYDQNIFSVDYALLDYRSGNHLPFAYRLKGFDTEWHDNSNQQRATYTNLPAGNYIFEVKCNDPDRYINLPYKSLAITVLAAPWATWWAYVIYAVIIGVVLVALRRNALTMLKLKHRVAVEQKLTELKLSFFTNISHELRTPLTLIINPINELARRGNLSRDDRQYLSIVQRNANRMVRFVNQLLDFRKVQSGKAKLNPSAVDMVAFINHVAEYFEEARQLKNIDFAFETDLDTAMVSIDQDKMETVLYNLLGNAYKFTPEGKKITVKLQITGETGDMIIDIADEGCGVLPSEINNLFDLYHEGSHPTAVNLKGTGIGLALSKELIELHQGTITAQNREPAGLLVRMILPMVAVETGSMPETQEINGKHELATAQKPDAELANVKPAYAGLGAPLLMLVEDNQDMRELITMQLSGTYRIETAADGEEGWGKILRMQPDIVLSDVMMPRMNGMELLNKIRNETATSHIPVILLTAKTAIENQIAGLRYGADYYITKPFDAGFLLTAVQNMIERRSRFLNEMIAGKTILNLNPGDIVVTSRDEMFLKKVLEVIDEHMNRPDFNIESVAGVANMSRQTFYRKLKSLTQLTPVEFVRDRRLLRAQQLLDAGSDNVTQIAYAVGFNSPKYFATCFRAKFNVSPSDYQRTAKPPEVIAH